MGTQPRATARRPRVAVVGGGFGGVAAVRALKRAAVDVVLIDRHVYNTFKPLLYQVATAGLNAGDVTWFLRALRARQANVHFIKGTVLDIDHGQKMLHLHGDVHIGYDYLVLASGVVANFFGIAGAEQFAMPLYGRSQALALRDRIFAELEYAAINAHDDEHRIVIVGAGPTGVETAGALAEFRNHDMPVAYPELDTRRVHVTLIDLGATVLAPFAGKSRRYAEHALAKRGVDLRLDSAVQEVREDGVLITHDGNETFIPARIVVWASGVIVDPVVRKWGVPQQARGGRIEVDEYQHIKGFDNEFAIGDVAIGPAALPQLGQPAMQGGRYVARLIAADIKGRPHALPPFHYKDRGTMAVVGRGAAIAEIKRLPPMTGFVAWVLWAAVHITGLLGARNRLATLANLAVKYFLGGSYNAIVGEAPDIVAKTRVTAPTDAATPPVAKTST